MKRKKLKWVGKKRYGHVKPMLSPFPKTIQTHLQQIFLQERNMMLLPPRLLNADQLAQIIGTETIVDIIINYVEACALLDSGATADLMTLVYAEARNFDIRPMSELSDHLINLRLAARFKTTLSSYIEYNLQIPGISSYDLD